MVKEAEFNGLRQDRTLSPYIPVTTMIRDSGDVNRVNDESNSDLDDLENDETLEKVIVLDLTRRVWTELQGTIKDPKKLGVLVATRVTYLLGLMKIEIGEATNAILEQVKEGHGDKLPQ